jgi:hypothetical protein
LADYIRSGWLAVFWLKVNEKHIPDEIAKIDINHLPQPSHGPDKRRLTDLNLDQVNPGIIIFESL